MSTFLILAAIGAAIYVFFKFQGEKKAVNAFALSDESDAWLRQHGLDPATGSFSVYSEPVLVSNVGATAIVGHALQSDGKAVGYAVEVLPGKGVVRGEIIDPFSVIGHHRHAAVAGREASRPILDVLQHMAVAVRAERAKQGS